MDREQQLRDELNAIADELNREWDRRSKPIVDELAKIEALKPPRPVMVVMGGGSSLLGDLLKQIVEDVGGCGDPDCQACGGARPKGETVQ